MKYNTCNNGGRARARAELKAASTRTPLAQYTVICVFIMTPCIKAAGDINSTSADNKVWPHIHV